MTAMGVKMWGDAIEPSYLDKPLRCPEHASIFGAYFEDEPGQRIRSRALAKLNSHYQNGFQVGLSVNFR